MTDYVMARQEAPARPDDPERSTLLAYVTESTLAIYRQWVADGKALSIERVTDLAAKLICRGAYSK